MDKAANLTGKMLIAMPGMRDPRFEQSVILICAHSDDGAMGLVVNRPLPDLDFSDLLAQLNIDASDDLIDLPSSSPAHARPFEEKRQAWSALAPFLA